MLAPGKIKKKADYKLFFLAPPLFFTDIKVSLLNERPDKNKINFTFTAQKNNKFFIEKTSLL